MQGRLLREGERGRHSLILPDGCKGWRDWYANCGMRTRTARRFMSLVQDMLRNTLSEFQFQILDSQLLRRAEKTLFSVDISSV